MRIFSARTVSLLLLFIAALTTSVGANSAHAPQPESLRLTNYYDIGSDRYREIEVACSNRTEQAIFKREQQREWCVGGPGTGDCFRDAMGAAKRACANSGNRSLAKR